MDAHTLIVTADLTLLHHIRSLFNEFILVPSSPHPALSFQSFQVDMEFNFPIFSMLFFSTIAEQRHTLYSFVSSPSSLHYPHIKHLMFNLLTFYRTRVLIFQHFVFLSLLAESISFFVSCG